MAKRMKTSITLKRERGDSSSNPDVVRLQEALAVLGLDIKNTDGIFDLATLRAVKSLQRYSNLKADGVVGPRTVRTINALLAQRNQDNKSVPTNMRPAAVPRSWRPLLGQAQQEAQIQAALHRRYFSKLDSRELLGFGVGTKTIDGEETGGLAAVFFVPQKTAKSKAKLSLPKTITVRGQRIPTDVQVGEISQSLIGQALNRARYRPVIPGGVSIQDVARNGPGTFGVRVIDRAAHPKKKVMLTAGHVITGLNAPVIQPGLIDGGVIPGDQVGIPGRRFIGNLPVLALPGFPVLFFFVDAGLVPVKKVRLNLPILHIGRPQNALLFPVRGLPIAKSGRTTGYTAGTVANPFFTGIANINGVRTLVANVIRSNNMQIGGGDSGSLVVTQFTNPFLPIAPLFAAFNNFPVGLLFAGDAARGISLSSWIGPALFAIRANIG